MKISTFKGANKELKVSLSSFERVQKESSAYMKGGIDEVA